MDWGIPVAGANHARRSGSGLLGATGACGRWLVSIERQEFPFGTNLSFLRRAGDGHALAVCDEHAAENAVYRCDAGGAGGNLDSSGLFTGRSRGRVGRTTRLIAAIGSAGV